jgi:hypothetical protein
MKPTDKDWVDAIGARLTEMLSSCQEINQDSVELISVSTQLGILANPGLLRQWKEGNSIIESDYFENENKQRQSSKRYKITRTR